MLRFENTRSSLYKNIEIDIVENFMLKNLPIELQNTAFGMKKYGYY